MNCHSLSALHTVFFKKNKHKKLFPATTNALVGISQEAPFLFPK
jgi:hypothetical protein